jgi:hypothetical protein
MLKEIVTITYFLRPKQLLALFLQQQRKHPQQQTEMRTRATTTPTAVGTAWLGTGSIFTSAKLKYKKK